jgi:phage baseplate assembly protein W
MFLYKHFVGGDAAREIDDIVRNLSYVLKTKRGTGYFLESFGLQGMGTRSTEEMLTLLTATVAENIRLYEPRVEILGIDEEHDDEGGGPFLVVDLKVRAGADQLRLVVDVRHTTFEITVLPQESRA